MGASRLLLRVEIVTIVAGCTLLDAAAQDLNFKRGQAEIILNQVAHDVLKHYYDPKLHGIDWDAKLRETKKKIESATSRNLAFANIAAMLDSLDDSHTFFIPPGRSFVLDYGWRFQTIGERCFVTRVRAQTDAATKVHPGDEVIAINDYKPTRANIVRIEYVLNVLRPQSKLEVTVRSAAGEERKLVIIPKVFQNQLASLTWNDRDPRLAGEFEHHRIRPRFVSLDGDVLAVKILKFFFNADEVSEIVGEARKHKSVILDLRGNPGGTEESLSLLVSGFFDHEVKIADAVARDSTKPRSAKPVRHPFSGKLTVLVDSRSTSTAELFARVVQLEKRGAVVGDHTAGMVMEAHPYGHAGHASASTVFGVSVTTANLIMSDGNSLEHVGVIPDELVLPTVDDLANHRDPVLAHAAEIAGARLSPKDAGELFPYEWPQPYGFTGH